ncbi:helix-turn-helix domain-containing protein [Paenibacillus mendelii]|uniref:Helix-turn-helix domain-containing protein n=1 Tax=Paenibacillus mendelii TaxID=206163 RepID=A0ABV6J8L6_9BACL|nr:helix-turn-helix transcriptional regulator [Paenibacillus mendelii]MCQ6559574.1 helix-turn-helix domain-containing protein [Paenibacillus mendelii]
MDVRKIGAFISERRKNRDYTQAELAMLLSVSHQAVSKWERGESLPDIGMLPGLAKLLETTVDELLNGEMAGNDEGHADIPGSAVSSGESAAPPVPLSAESSDSSSGLNGNSAVRQQLTWDHVISLAPFLSQEILESMMDQIEGDPSVSALSALAPFAGRPALERLAGKMDGPIPIRDITGIAPFLGKDLLERLLMHAVGDSIGWDDLSALAPFVERHTLSQLILQVSGGAPDPWTIVGLAPFLEPTALLQVIERIEPGSLSPAVLPGLAPFLPQEQLNKLVLQF